jgi:hypothetical protein
MTLGIAVALLMLAGCSSPTLTGVHLSLAYPADAPRPDVPSVELRYLGNGGWLIRRGSDVIATAPFASNPTGLAIYSTDVERIRERIPPMPDVEAMLIGHTHYDHAMDLPYVMENLAQGATLYGSETMTRLFRKTLGDGRVVDVSKPHPATPGGATTQWYPAPDGPVRFMALPSSHAPHILGFIKVVSWRKHLDGDVPKGELPTIPAAWPEGETLAFLIDFLRPDGSVEFRIYYQDAAADPGKGTIPALSSADEAPVDVAILCVAGFSQVERSPETILRNVKPRYVVGGHWENFFGRSPDLPPAVAFGTDLSEFVRRAQEAATAPIYIPEPGRTLYIPIAPR